MRNVLSCQNLSLKLGKQQVLHNVSANFQTGLFTAMLGANGSGKSTFLRLLLGLIPSCEGSIALQGNALTSLSRRQIANMMAYLPQENFCPDHLTVGELIELAGFAQSGLFGGPTREDRDRFRHALETVGLAGFEKKRVTQLSGGQRQRAFIAMVLAQDTPLILMDEPVNHLDLKYQYAILDLIRSLVTDQGKTVIIVMHDINLALAYADDAVILKEGRVLTQGPVADVLTPPVIWDGFDMEVDRLKIDGRILCLPKSNKMVVRS